MAAGVPHVKKYGLLLTEQEREPALRAPVLRARVLPQVRALPGPLRALPEQGPVPEHSDCMRPAK
jgi:hypothetical protein